MGVEAGVSVGWVAGESLGSRFIESVWSSGVVSTLSRSGIELGPDCCWFCRGWSCSAMRGGADGPEEDPPLPRPPLAFFGAILTVVKCSCGQSARKYICVENVWTM
jgi:hypothetical protein